MQCRFRLGNKARSSDQSDRDSADKYKRNAGEDITDFHGKGHVGLLKWLLHLVRRTHPTLVSAMNLGLVWVRGKPKLNCVLPATLWLLCMAAEKAETSPMFRACAAAAMHAGAKKAGTRRCRLVLTLHFTWPQWPSGRLLRRPERVTGRFQSGT